MENFIGIIILGLIVWGAFALEAKDKKDRASGKTTRFNVLRERGVGGALSSFCTTADGNGQWLFWNSATNRMWYFPANSTNPREINRENLQSAEVLVDGASVMHANRTRQIGGALVGAALAGPVGAVIGGLGAKAKTKEYIKRVDLRIVLNTGSSSIINIPMAKAPGKGAKKGSFLYKDFDTEALEWHSYLTRILNDVSDTENSVAQSLDLTRAGKSEEDPLIGSKINRLKDLSDLKNSGAITEEEFDSIKRDLLNDE